MPKYAGAGFVRRRGPALATCVALFFPPAPARWRCAPPPTGSAQPT